MRHLSTAERIGREDGIKEGGRVLLMAQIEEKYGILPDWVAERLSKLTSGQLDRLARRILTAATLEELGL